MLQKLLPSLQQRGRLWLIGLAVLAMGGLIAPPARAYEKGRPYYLGMGNVSLGIPGASVDLPTGALMLHLSFPALPGRIHHPIGFFFNSEDSTAGPVGTGTTLTESAYLTSGASSGLDLILPGEHWFHFEYNYTDSAYEDSRDPEMLGAKFVQGSQTYSGTLTLKDGAQWLIGDTGSGNGLLYEIVDRYGNFLQMGQQGTGWAVNYGGSTYPRVDYFRGSNSQVSSITETYAMSGGNPPARTWSLAYDGSNRLSSITDPKGGVTRYTWTTYTRTDGKVLPLISTITSPNGNLILTAHYYGSGRIYQAVTPDGTTSFSYSAGLGSNGTTTVTDPLGHARSWSYTWPAAPTGETAKFGYFLTSTTDALGRQTQFAATHSGSNLVTQITDYRGRVSTQSWDYTKGNLLTCTTPTASGGTATASWTYATAFNLVSSATDALGRTSSATIDPSTGNVTKTTDARNYSTNFTYNSTGDCATTTNALNQERLLYYDYYGDLNQISDGQNTLYSATFDQAGRKLSETDATGKVTQYSWDALDRVTATTRTHNGQAVTTSVQFDADGNRIRLTDPNSHVWQWSFDAMDRVQQATNPLSQSVTLAYDAGSNLQSSTDALNQQAVFSYDSANRILSKTFKRADGSTESTVSYNYDSTTHLLTSVTDSLFGTTSWTYDSLDRAITEAGPNGSLTFTLNAKIDRREGLTVSGQSAISYGFDNNDNTTSISQNGLTTTTSYDALNRRSQQTQGNGVVTNWAYDTHGFVSSVLANNGSLDGHTYTRDLAGDILREVTNGQTLTYGYDDLYRLTSFTSTITGNSESWTFDLAGNRLSQTINGSTTSYTYNNADQVTAVNGVGVLTDANGNVTQDETGGTYAWDVRGRLSSLSRSGVSSIFGYNQDGLRVSKLVNGVTTTYLLDGDQVVQENAGGVVTDLLQGPGTDNLLERGGNWLLHNCLNSTSGVTNGSGGLLQTYSYEPWGQASIVGGGAVQPYQFTGREADESGLMYYRARYYNPSWGRFMSADPIGFAGGINPYAYCGNNPVSASDPSGKAAAAALLLLLSPEVAVPVAATAAITIAAGVGLHYLFEHINEVMRTAPDPASGAGSSGPNSGGGNTGGPAAGGGGGGGGTPPQVPPPVPPPPAPANPPSNPPGTPVPGTPNYVVTPGGTAIPVNGGDGGWPGRVANNGQGLVYQQPGSTGNANSLRIAQPNADYPEGYIRTYNEYGQPLDQNGRPGDQASTHIGLDQLGGRWNPAAE